MGKREVRRLFGFGAAGAVVMMASAPLSAHPHAVVEQQAMLSLGTKAAVATYYLAPSPKDGAHMFEHIDSNGDKVLSRAEKFAFAKNIVAKSALTVDDRPVKLTLTHFAFPSRAAMASGEGGIRLKAKAPVALSTAKPHRLSFDVDYHAFSHKWFVQPFYSAKLTANGKMPKLSRTKGSSKVTIAL